MLRNSYAEDGSSANTLSPEAADTLDSRVTSLLNRMRNGAATVPLKYIEDTSSALDLYP